MGEQRGPASRATWHMPEALLREWTSLTGSLGAPRRVAAGEVLFRREEPSDGFFLLEEGLAKASAVTGAGTERLVEIMAPGSLFGEGPALEGSRRLFTVQALAPSRLRQYRVGPVTEAMAADARIGLCLIRIMAAKQRSLAHRLVEVSAQPPRERLRELLERLAPGLGAAGSRLPLTHEEIGSYLGLSRITVTRTLALLRGDTGRPPGA